MDEALSMTDWLGLFQSKLPMITESEWKAALNESKIRPFSHLTWQNLHEKFENAVEPSTTDASLTMTLASSEDPS